MDVGILKAFDCQCGDKKLVGWHGDIEAPVLPGMGMMRGNIRLTPLPPEEVKKNEKRVELSKNPDATVKEFAVEFSPKSNRGVYSRLGDGGYRTDRHGNLYLNFWVVHRGIIGVVASFNAFAFDDENDTSACVQSCGEAVIKMPAQSQRQDDGAGGLS